MALTRSGDPTQLGAAPAAPSRPTTLKARHRAMWASGDYPRIVREFVGGLGPQLVTAAGVAPGDHVLDVACGTGSAAIPAAYLGAEVVASDLTPELFTEGRRRALDAGADLDWVEADAEALPFADAAFDVVMSCIGAMFAPHHEVTASEMLRVCRPGGTIAMINWTPDSVVGDLFRAMKPYAPAPPPGAQPPPLWGDEDHVRALFGDHVDHLAYSRHTLPVGIWTSPAAARDYFKAYYGPTVAVYRASADDPDRTAALDHDLEQAFARSDTGDAGGSRWSIDYAIVTAERR